MPTALIKVPRTAAAFLLAAAVTVTGLQIQSAHAAGEPYRDSSLPVATRVDDLLSRMTLDEKIGQMTQAERVAVSNSDIVNYKLGSLLSGGGSAPSPNTAKSWADMYDGFQNAALTSRLGIPIIYGVDAVHGHNNVQGATIFPHNIGLGATRDPALVQQIGRATAEEVSGTGIDWDFSPCLCVVRNDRWGRSYESFGETPALPTMMTSYIDGLQGTSLNAPGSVLATAKHYIGDGGTDNGVNTGNATMSEAELRAIHLPPFQEAIRHNVGSVMISYNSWNGVKDHGNKYLITDLLKGELGFSGFVVSDWNGIDEIDGQPGFTAAEVTTAINAGIDMVMVPNDWQKFITTLRGEVQNGHVPMSRIDDANRRILTKKFQLGLFEKPLTDRSYTPTVGSAAHRALARQAVRESQVLLKNSGNILPLAKTNNKIFVAGKSADDIGNQSGGWTISWQGSSGNITTGTTVLQGIRAAAGSGTTVTYNSGGTGIDSSYKVAVAVIGETPYAEGSGDRPSSMGLDSTDLATLNTLKASGVPVVVVLVSGRPLDIAAQLPDWKGLVAAWLPGTEGNGVSDVLFGDYAPTGKLPSTWMQSASQQPINDGDGKTPLFPFGFGLTYGGTSPSHSAYDVTQAESFSSQSGTQTETTTDTGGGQDVGYITAGDWLAYNDVDFGTTGATSVSTRLASGAATTGTVQYRLDSTTGPVIATVPVTSTGGWQNWTTTTANLTTAATGKHTVYLTFTTNGTGDLVNLNWFQFKQSDSVPPNAYQQRRAESFSSQSGTQTETTTDTGGGQDVGYITAGDWLAYNDVDFGTTGATSVSTRLASGATTTGTVQYRLDSTTGPVIATVPVTSTGGWQNWTTTTTANLTTAATGKHTVYLTFTTNGTGDLVNLNWFQFKQ
ncbi:MULTISPECIES: glycoside hydrolase family 3 N-terminal domain-containing protein [unclassified Streptomyces]|uniref:glycoside hydrolase family 3 N-terminal domain-containing protein n=1 Tax=unclassified Streptomyces TaxID=2593676 RepID=UPI002E2E78E5|nr:glycoside hydrolase family 3 N-terminal domain-containing protein [Streptomyces sp. NBC_00223]